MRRFWQYIILAASAAHWAQATTVVDPTYSDHQHQDPKDPKDPKAKSIVTLNPDPFEEGWRRLLTFRPVGQVQEGRVGWYRENRAEAYMTYWGGAQVLEHNRGTREPAAAADLFWIQTVDYNTAFWDFPSRETYKRIDVYKAAHDSDSDYWGGAQFLAHNRGAEDPAAAADLFWIQTVDYDTGDFRSKVGSLKIYDGVYWGFNIEGPEPSSLFLAGIGVMLVLLGRLRKGQRSACSELTASPQESLRLM